MGKFSLFATAGCLVCLAVACAAQGAKDEKSKDVNKNAAAASPKTTLKRETLPIARSKSSGPNGKSIESLRTASQTLFGYNGQNGFGGGQFGGQGGQFGFAPSYAGGGGGGNGFGQGGFGQYNQPGSGSYNLLGQNQYFGAQGGNPYYSNGYFGGAYNGYPYASTGGNFGSYPFASPQGQGGFGGFGGGFGNQGYYPQYQGQVGNRNFGFVNQGFGNPAFRNPSGAPVGGSSGISSIPSSVQVGTGLEVGSRGFGGGVSNGAFPSASGQQYIVGNGIGQPAFISSSPSAGSFGFGSPYGMYTPGIPGGLYRSGGPNSIFGPYSLSGSPPPPPSAISSRPSSSGATRLQTSTGPNRFYQGAGPGGTYAPNSRERLYRFTSSNES